MDGVRGVSEEKILPYLKKELSSHRYRHTLAVTQWAEALAQKHGEDPGRARLAGLLHDCAKEYSGRRLKQLVEREPLPVAVPHKKFILTHRRYNLFHAYASAFEARKIFGVEDRGVLQAIACHTLGARRMPALSKILYVADFSSPDRPYKKAKIVRQKARRDLNDAFKTAVQLKIYFTLEGGGAVHPQTLQLWNQLTLRKESP